MNALVSALVPIIIILAIALVVWWATERFSPDALITKIVKLIIFVVVLIAVLTKLVPLI
jgi:hypothetical protein